MSCNCSLKGDPFKAPEQHAIGCPESLESRQREKIERLETALRDIGQMNNENGNTLDDAVDTAHTALKG